MAAGVGGFLGAQVLASPTPAAADHAGFVKLAHYNTSPGLDPTAIETDVGSYCFVARHKRTAGTGSATRGVYGEAWSPLPGTAGVRGVATAADGATSGVEGVSVSSIGTGVLGVANGGGTAKGVQGRSSSGTGVLGLGSLAGVWGTCDSASGAGVLADNTADGLAIRARGRVRLEGALDVGASTGPSFSVDPATPPLGQTAILVQRNVGGTLSLQRVSVGAANSAGTGFRALRVPN